jgi:hypothetical protein
MGIAILAGDIPPQGIFPALSVCPLMIPRTGTLSVFTVSLQSAAIRRLRHG